LFEEASGGPWASVGPAGALPLGLQSGTATQDTTNKKQGAAAVTVGGQLGVADAVFQNLVSPLSVGCWARPTATPASGFGYILNKWGNSGYLIDQEGSNYLFYIRASTVNTSAVATGLAPLNTYTHVVGTYIHPLLTIYTNGAARGTATATAPLPTEVQNFQISTSGTFAYVGQAEECFVMSGAMDAPSVCRVCSCGLDGLLCTCQGTAFATKGRNTADCGSCTLPADCTGPTPVVVTSTTTSTVTTSTLAGTLAPSWVAATVAAWMFDEASGNARVNAQGTTSRNLAEGSGPIAADATNKMEGVRSAGPLSGSAQNLWNQDATLKTLGAPVTCGFWARKTGNGGTMLSIANNVNGNGFRVTQDSGGNFSWYFATTGMSFTPAAGTGVWAHVAVRQNGTASQTYLNGVPRESSTRTLTTSTGGFFVAGGEENGATYQGNLDELWCAAGAWSDASICRVCSCGLRGEQCTCSGTSYVITGRNASACGSCTLPADCSAATPP